VGDYIKPNLPNADSLLDKAKVFYQEKKLDNTRLTLKQIIYFNYDNKIITLSNPSKGSKFTFKMVSTYNETGTMVGTTLNILVTSTNALAVKRFFFSPDDLPGVIWMENKDGKTTTFGGLTRL
jgi:hypothetical protein